MKEKQLRLVALLDEITNLTELIETDEKNDTPENREKLSGLLVEGESIRKNIETANAILGLKNFVTQPIGSPAGGDGEFSQEFTAEKSLGELFVDNDDYKTAIKGGKVDSGLRAVFEAKGFLFPAVGRKATFDRAAGGLDSTVNYVNMGAPVMIEQQRLTIRDLLAAGQTTLNSIPFIKEAVFVNGAEMVGEEGEKPEASLQLTTATAPVKKIAVTIKVTDEMFADFPMMRDYVNTRLSFMVKAKEEQQLLGGTGSGDQITGILNTSGILTQPKGGDTNADAIHKAITKVRTPASSVAGYEPDAMVINPTDWQTLRLAKDAENRYYGGGPFGTLEGDTYWGLRVVITTAISQGTVLVGAFKLGAQIWDREGIRIDATNSNEDDFNYNRVSLRVEERLGLAVYRPSAFCTVTGVS